jgi:hypothetical protein
MVFEFPPRESSWRERKEGGRWRETHTVKERERVRARVRVRGVFTERIISDKTVFKCNRSLSGK